MGIIKEPLTVRGGPEQLATKTTKPNYNHPNWLTFFRGVNQHSSTPATEAIFVNSRASGHAWELAIHDAWHEGDKSCGPVPRYAGEMGLFNAMFMGYGILIFIYIHIIYIYIIFIFNHVGMGYSCLNHVWIGDMADMVVNIPWISHGVWRNIPCHQHQWSGNWPRPKHPFGTKLVINTKWFQDLTSFDIPTTGKTLSKWRFLAGKIIYTYPICSMYGICINIYPKRHPNVGKYTMHGASGYGICKSIAMVDCRVSVFQIFEMAQQRTATSW